MPNPLTTTVRPLSGQACIIDIQGDITAQAEATLMAAYNQASQNGTSAIILNFDGLDYMNSSGIGLLVTMLIRVQRQKQRLLAYGLSDHYRQIFELTRLNEAIGIFHDEAAAVTAVAHPN
ncbi:MAG: STAS domain-containing protein [Anaerolineales bacterium]|nr:STAS domain-containing protein [Anaerolineales bacterium]MCB8983592.1 STAS domain-containing protein [Ardenticatenaceae bacterium]